MTRRLMPALTALVLLLAAFVAAAPAQAHRGRPAPRPVIFVHGFSGSGSQYETPARRFASNGYPAARVEAHEYDSTFATAPLAQVWAGLDARIARLRAETGADKVDLAAHSLGTFVSQGYLNSSPERAATVAHYVNLDGAPATAQPGGVPTLAIWGEGPATRTVVGARNVSFPDQSHTQTVTSAESFAETFRFFTGRDPRTTRVVPQRGAITLAGRAVLFPENTGAAGTTLTVHRVDPRSGRRIGRTVARVEIGADGAWGPIRARGDAHYEFALQRPDGPVHHLYYQPFRRTDLLVRLLTSAPGSLTDTLTDKSDRHANLTLSRYKEWWGDQGANGDSLRVNGTEVLNAATAPRTKRLIGLFAFDAGSDGVSRPDAALPQFAALPFLGGVDLFAPAAQPPDGRVRIVVRPRATDGRPDVVTVPNWASSGHRISVQLDDY